MKPKTPRALVLMIVTAMFIAAPALAAAEPSEDARTNDDIRRALVRLPYYGVFDYLTFQYDKGTVTLSGTRTGPR